ncbi:ATP-dependent endonuclease [Sesbania bispinosa]|nr:ATP-dependent endonuclease [Sesbania bispinosa]
MLGGIRDSFLAIPFLYLIPAEFYQTGIKALILELVGKERIGSEENVNGTTECNQELETLDKVVGWVEQRQGKNKHPIRVTGC